MFLSGIISRLYKASSPGSYPCSPALPSSACNGTGEGNMYTETTQILEVHCPIASFFFFLYKDFILLSAVLFYNTPSVGPRHLNPTPWYPFPEGFWFDLCSLLFTFWIDRCGTEADSTLLELVLPRFHKRNTHGVYHLGSIRIWCGSPLLPGGSSGCFDHRKDTIIKWDIPTIISILSSCPASLLNPFNSFRAEWRGPIPNSPTYSCAAIYPASCISSNKRLIHLPASRSRDKGRQESPETKGYCARTLRVSKPIPVLQYIIAATIFQNCVLCTWEIPRCQVSSFYPVGLGQQAPEGFTACQRTSIAPTAALSSQISMQDYLAAMLP